MLPLSLRLVLTSSGSSWVPGTVLPSNVIEEPVQLSGSGYWSTSNVSVSGNVGNAPDGTPTAHKIIENTANSVHLLQSNTVTVPSGAFVTMSAYVSASGRDKGLLYIVSVSDRSGLYFDLGAVTTQVFTDSIDSAIVSTDIESVGDGWYKVNAITRIHPTASAFVMVCRLRDASGNSTYVGDGVSGMSWWNAKVSYNDKVDDNLITYPTALESASWTYDGVTVPSRSMTQPFNNDDARYLTEDTSVGAHFASCQVTVPSGSPVVISTFLSASGRSRALIYSDIAGGLNRFGSLVNLNTATVTDFEAGTGVVYNNTITDVGNGWYHVYVRGLNHPTASLVVPAVRLADDAGSTTYTGNGSASLAVYDVFAGTIPNNPEIVFDTRHIPDVPVSDGQSFDVLDGKVQIGGYNVQIIDIPTITGRAVTDELTNARGRLRFLGYRGFLQYSTDDEATWNTMVAGFTNGIRLVNALVYEVGLSDSLRIDRAFRPFRDISDINHPYNRASCIVGGPVKSGFAGFHTNEKAALVRVTNIGTEPVGYGAGKYQTVTVEYEEIYIPEIKRGGPKGMYRYKQFPTSEAEYVNAYMSSNAYDIDITAPATGSVAVDGEFQKGVIGVFTNFVAEVLPESTSGPSSYYVPAFVGRKGAINSEEVGPAFIYKTGTGNAYAGSTILWDSGSLPTVGKKFRMYVWKSTVSDSNPVHIEDHPVDVVSKLWTYAGISHSLASTASVKAELPGVWVQYRWKEGEVTLDDFISKHIFSPFGISYRTNENGDRELFTSRVRPSVIPSGTVTINTLRGNSRDGSDASTLFDVDDNTIITKVISKQKRFQGWDSANKNDRPIDEIVEGDDIQTVQFASGTLPSYVGKEITIEIPGTICVSQAMPASSGTVFNTQRIPIDFRNFAQGIAYELFDVFEDGGKYSSFTTLNTLFSASLGDEVILDLPHLPTPNIGSISTRGNQRVVQVIGLTPNINTTTYRVLDRGNASQLSTVPTFSVAQNSFDRSHYFTLRILNSGTLNTERGTVRVEAVQSVLQPTASTVPYMRLLTPLTSSYTSHRGIPSGTYWVRMRTESGSAQRPSAYSSWQNITLNPLATMSVSGFTTATGSVGLGWFNGDTSLPIEIWISTGSRQPVSGSLVASLPAGSTRYTYFTSRSAVYSGSLRYRDTTPGAVIYGPWTNFAFTGSPYTIQLSAPVSPIAFVGGKV